MGPGSGLTPAPAWRGPCSGAPSGPLRGPCGPSPGPCPLAGSGAFAVCSHLSAPQGVPACGPFPPAGFACACGAPLASSLARWLGASPACARPSLGGGFPPRLPGLRAGASLGHRQEPSPSGPVAARSGRVGPALPCGAPPALWSGSLAVALPPLRARPFRPFFGGPPLPSGAGPPLPPRACGPARPFGAALAPPAGGAVPACGGLFPAPPPRR